MTRTLTTTALLMALTALLLPAAAKAAELNLPQKASGTTIIDKAFNGVEGEYNSIIRLNTIGVGAPNQTTRDTTQPPVGVQPTKLHQVRLIPNAADRLINSLLNWSAHRAGASTVNATSHDALPRYTMVTDHDIKGKR